jgi:universal stress protein family protein
LTLSGNARGESKRVGAPPHVGTDDEVSMRSKRRKGFQSVLCGVDCSDQSRLALRNAEAIASRAKATLTIALVNDALLVASAAAAGCDRQLATESASQLSAFIETVLGCDVAKAAASESACLDWRPG